MTTLPDALRYAARGWPVLPVWPAVQRDGRWLCACREGAACTHPGKHPMGARGVVAATRYDGAISDGWARLAARWGVEPSVAIATGGGDTCGAQRLLVVDVDARAYGDETWSRLVSDHGRVDTVTALTPGGVHLYFDASGFGRIPSSAGRVGQGIDIRAAGGYVVAPPSAHVSGRTYRWEASSDPDDGTELARVPDWLVRLAREPAPRSDAVVRGALGAGRLAGLRGSQTIGSGERNATLARVACSLRARGLEETELLESLHALNRDACAPPLPAREVAAIGRGVCRRYPSGLSGCALAEVERAEVSAALAQVSQGDYPWKGDPEWLARSMECDPSTLVDPMAGA